MTDQSVNPPSGGVAQSGAAPSPALPATNAAGADSSPPLSLFPVSKLHERRLVAVVFAALTEYVPDMAEDAIDTAIAAAKFHTWSRARMTAAGIIEQVALNLMWAAGAPRSATKRERDLQRQGIAICVSHDLGAEDDEKPCTSTQARRTDRRRQSVRSVQGLAC